MRMNPNREQGGAERTGSCAGACSSRDRRLKVLILLDRNSLYTNAVKDHLGAFARYSRHEIVYTHATCATAPLPFSLDAFDVIIIHYSVRLAVDWHLAPPYAHALRNFKGLKVLFIQDEYDNTWQACRWIEWLKIGVVFTCVPLQHVPSIYSRVDHKHVTFVPTLTGYLPLSWDSAGPVPPLRERRIVIGYRGRELSFRYGMLAREKWLIGKRMRASCLVRGIAHDIEWSEKHRIYGPQWHEFLASCRATLGSESGSNVFDFDGSLEQTVKDAMTKTPGALFEEIYEDHVRAHERDGLMNQVSPRIFEAIAARTGLILFEGSYSGVVQPEEHYIPLKKDFSNVEEVLTRVRDNSYLEPMIERAYQHVIGKGLYTYRRFVEGVDRVLAERAPSQPESSPAALAACLATKGCQKDLDSWPSSQDNSVSSWLQQLPLVGPTFRAWGTRWDQIRAAKELFRKEADFRVLWDEIRRDPANRAAFGKLLASYKEFIHLTLLRCTCLKSNLSCMPWTVTADYDAQAGCLRFTSQSFYRLDTEASPEPILQACAAIRAGNLKQVVWMHAPPGPLYLVPFGSGQTVYFFLSDSGTLRFPGLERLAGINPELAVRLLLQVSGVKAQPDTASLRLARAG
jgi:hypothetical protein